MLVSWKAVMWPPTQCLPKELFQMILIICDFFFCVNVRTSSSKRKCFLNVCSQARNTKKCLTEKINRITSEDGQGRFWVGGGSFFSSFMISLQVSESSLILRSQAGGWAQNFQKIPWYQDNHVLSASHRAPCLPSRRCCTKCRIPRFAQRQVKLLERVW